MRIAVVAVCVGMGAGCTTSYSVEDYFQDLGAMHCARMRDCCTSGEYSDWWTADSSGDMYSCLATWQHPSSEYAIKKGLDEGRIHFDAAQAHICVDALQELACPMFEPAMRYRETYCTSPFHGTLANDATCSADEECVSTSCVFAPGQPSGRCMERIPSGGSCASTDADCTGADRCQTTSDGQGAMCGLGQPAGFACSTDDQCIDHWCKGAGLFTTGHCIRACDGG